MKEVLVVYFTRTGHSEKLAEEIGIKLQGKLDEIKSKRSYQGFAGFFEGGYRALSKKEDSISYGEDPSEYKVVVIVSPIWASNMPPAIRRYIKENINNMKNYALIINGSAKENKKAYGNFTILLKNPISEYVVDNSDIDYEICQKNLEDFADKIRFILEREEKNGNNEE